MNPVVAVRVSNAAVERVRRQHENEVGRLANADEQVLVKPADAKALDVDVDAEAVQRQVDFQQTTTHDNNHTRSPLNTQQIGVDPPRSDHDTDAARSALGRRQQLSIDTRRWQLSINI